MRLTNAGGGPRSRAVQAACVLLLLVFPGTPAKEAEPATSQLPAMNDEMGSVGWVQDIVLKLENEAIEDIGMLPETPGALAREWRSFDRQGSALGALVNFGWVAVAAGLALLAQRLVRSGLTARVRRFLRMRPEGPTLGTLLQLLLCDLIGLGVFSGVLIYSRHWLMAAGVAVPLVIFAVNVLVRWRISALIIDVVLRPAEPSARIVDLPNGEARRLAWFLSGTILLVTTLAGFARYYALMDVDSGASHVMGLMADIIVCGLFVGIVYRAQTAAEALIRGRASGTIVAALRAAIARAWLVIGLTAVAALFLFFVFGLSLGLLSYYYGAISSLGVLFILLVFDGLTQLGWHDVDQDASRPAWRTDQLLARSMHRMLRMLLAMSGVLALVWIWTEAIEVPAAEETRALHATAAALATLLIAYLAWVLCRLTIDRHLQGVGVGPKLPGSDDDSESTPGSRLQTMLPLLRAAFGIVIAVIAALIVLSRLGIDTAPLIAGAGVFGLAISFGSQSLVRDIISGLFYMWDDAFRVGEYLDTGRLKGTVEKLGIRSLKLRHHNGPLHTIPYGQLGAVTNLSRDFATTKFNLKLEPGTDVELVRRTAKQIGLAMQHNPEIAVEVILPLKMQGIAEITDNGVIVRFKFTARPVRPSWVQREYLKRMYLTFAEKGIRFASGALMVQTTPLLSAAPPRDEKSGEAALASDDPPKAERAEVPALALSPARSLA
ncbi:MAG: mechanosensitive ion channel [Acetobacteraceae bacterium]|nr:mechanosensitive ion channel [Acetobacteraceae bacterium]